MTSELWNPLENFRLNNNLTTDVSWHPWLAVPASFPSIGSYGLCSSSFFPHFTWLLHDCLNRFLFCHLPLLVQSLRHVWLFATPWAAACQASLSFTISQSLFKLMSTEWMMSPNHLIPCFPFLLLPSIFPSIRVFSKGSALRIRCPKYWSFSFSISASNEYLGLISFKIDCFDLLAVQGTLVFYFPQ